MRQMPVRKKPGKRKPTILRIDLSKRTEVPLREEERTYGEDIPYPKPPWERSVAFAVTGEMRILVGPAEADGWRTDLVSPKGFTVRSTWHSTEHEAQADASSLAKAW